MLHLRLKLILTIACVECGHSFDAHKDDPRAFDVNIYFCESMENLAGTFVDEGLYGEIPERLAHYINYDAIARNLSVDFTGTEIAGQRLVNSCA